MDHSR
jgi:hypothetical protein